MLRMIRMLCGSLLLAGLAGLFWPSAGFSQSTPPADAPAETLSRPARVAETPESPQTPSPTIPPPGGLPPAPAVPPSWFIPGPNPALVPGGVYQENGVLGPPGQWSGWFANVEAGLIKPHIDSHLNNGGNVVAPFLTNNTSAGSLNTGNGASNTIILFGDKITLPVASLNWTGGPRLRLGYRLPDGAGQFRMEWSMVASQGTDTIANFDASGAGFLRSRLNVQSVSFTYGTDEFVANAPRIDRTWGARFGLSAADVFFDSRARASRFSNSPPAAVSAASVRRSRPGSRSPSPIRRSVCTAS